MNMKMKNIIWNFFMLFFFHTSLFSYLHNIVAVQNCYQENGLSAKHFLQTVCASTQHFGSRTNDKSDRDANANKFYQKQLSACVRLQKCRLI